MEADPEHQQDDADLGQLHRQPGVGDEPRRERADEDAREQIAGNRRNPQSLRQRPHEECDAKPGNDGSDQGGVVRHGFCLGGGSAWGQPARPFTAPLDSGCRFVVPRREQPAPARPSGDGTTKLRRDERRYVGGRDPCETVRKAPCDSDRGVSETR